MSRFPFSLGKKSSARHSEEETKANLNSGLSPSANKAGELPGTRSRLAISSRPSFGQSLAPVSDLHRQINSTVDKKKNLGRFSSCCYFATFS